MILFTETINMSYHSLFSSITHVHRLTRCLFNGGSVAFKKIFIETLQQLLKVIFSDIQG
jgi:hypothetical protein